MAHLNSTSDKECDDPENAAEGIVSLHYQMQDIYNKEVEVYRILGKYQGKRVPRVFTTLTVSASSSHSEAISKYTDSPGILMSGPSEDSGRFIRSRPKITLPYSPRSIKSLNR